MVYDIIRTELTAIRDKFGDDRRTDIETISGEVDIEDLIPEQQSVITLTHGGYIKRQPVEVYRTQRRGGRASPASPARMRTLWRICSSPPPTITFCSSPTAAKCTA